MTQIFGFLKNTKYDVADCGRSRPAGGASTAGSNTHDPEVVPYCFIEPYDKYQQSYAMFYVATNLGRNVDFAV